MVKISYILAGGRRQLIWVGSSLKDLRGFSKPLRLIFGFQIDQIEQGETPEAAKAGEIPGTMKLLEDYEGDTFRVVYAVKLKTAVYVLHAFKKKSKSGHTTPKADLDLVRRRLKEAGEIDKLREKPRDQRLKK